MTAERSVFALVEHVADALHPYRWWLFSITIGVWSFGCLLLLLGYLGYPALPTLFITPRLGAPLGFTLIAWSWSAFLLSTWFSPGASRPASERATYFRRVRHAISVVGRAWALLVLTAFVLSPVVLWLVVWGILH